MTTCNNCNQPFEYKFCGFCGQSTAMNGRVGFKDFATDIFHSIFHTGGGLFYTLKMLFVKPEMVIEGYIGGKRKMFFSSIKLFLIFGVLYVYTNHLVSKNITDRGTQTLEYYFQHYKYLMIFGPVLLTALLNWATYHKRKLRFTEHFIASMYVQSALYIISIIWTLANFFAGWKLIMVGIVIQIFYYAFAMTRFYNKKHKFTGAVANVFLFVLISIIFLLPFVLLTR